MKAWKDSISGMSKELVVLLKRFFLPFGKRPASLLVLLAAVVLVGWLHIATGVPELIIHNYDEALMLAADALVLATEPTSKIGPDLAEESIDNAEIVRKYVDHLERGYLCHVVRWLYPEQHLKRQLSSLWPTLKKAPRGDEEGARKVLLATGTQIDKFCMRAEEFSSRPLIWFKSERLPAELITDLNNALTRSHKQVDILVKSPNMENALESCMANRRTMLMLFLARLGYNEKGRINQFLSDARKARDQKRTLAEGMKDVRNKRALLEWANSEQRRINILEAMLANDMDKVRELLRETIEKAYKKKRGSLAE